jgi:uncharacterized protein YndB with AHSA1/START domain
MFGLVLGVLTGVSRLVRTYDWHARWQIPEPRSNVYEAFTDLPLGRAWWPSMEVTDRSPRLVEGSFIDIRMHQVPALRRLAPPFRMHGVITYVEPGVRLRQRIAGDLDGVVDVHFRDLPEGATEVVFDWYVRMGNPMLNLLGFVLSPLYRKSHDSVLAEGEKGLREFLART